MSLSQQVSAHLAALAITIDPKAPEPLRLLAAGLLAGKDLMPAEVNALIEYTEIMTAAQA